MSSFPSLNVTTDKPLCVPDCQKPQGDSCGYAYTLTHTGGMSGSTVWQITPHGVELWENACWPVFALFLSPLSRLFEEHIPKFLPWQTHPDGAAVKPRKRPHSESTNTHMCIYTHTQWDQRGMWSAGSQVSRMWTVRWETWNQDLSNTKLPVTVASDWKVRYEINLYCVFILKKRMKNSNRTSTPTHTTYTNVLFTCLIHISTWCK